MKDFKQPLLNLTKRAAIAALKTYQARAIDQQHREEAETRYRAIIGQHPDRALSDARRRQIGEYAHDVLGSVTFAPWLEAYTALRGEFREGWLPDNYIERYLVPFSSGRMNALSTRSLANRLLQTDLFPDLAYGVNGAIYDTSYEPLELSALAKHLFAERETAFLKIEGSIRGFGVTRLDAGSFDPGALPKGRDFVIQRAVRQHPFFDELSPDAAATLRITTVKQPGRKSEARGAFLRLGRAGATVVGHGSSLSVPVVDTGTGALASYGVLKDWVTTDRHPDTGVTFASRTIPSFRAVIDACTALHDRLPHIWYIGWDTCVTSSGEVVLFEFNTGHAGVKLPEAATGPHFLGLGWDRLHLREGPSLPIEIRPAAVQSKPDGTAGAAGRLH